MEAAEAELAVYKEGRIGKTLLVLGVRYAVGAILLMSSLPKLERPFEFLSSVYSYELVGPKLGLGVAIVVPWIEVTSAVLLLAGIAIRPALLCSLVLFGMFSFATGSAAWRRIGISCGCFNSAEEGAVSYLTVARATALCMACAVALFLSHPQRQGGAERGPV